MLRISLIQRLRPRLVRFAANTTNEQATVYDGSKWEMDSSTDTATDLAPQMDLTTLLDTPEVVSNSISVPEVAVNGLENFSFEMVNTTDLTFIQQFFFDTYCAASDTLGISPFIAIPTTVLVGRIMLFPLYVRMRRKMPKFLLANTKMQVLQKHHMVKMEKGEYDVYELERESKKMDEHMKTFRSELFSNYPIFELLPLGFFMTGNLWATWAICNSVTAAVPFLWIGDVFAFDPFVAAFATGCQVTAIYMGAETGITTEKEKDEDMQARIQRGVNKFFIGMTAITFPIQWYFSCPAFISACWMGNTLITLSFSKIILKNAENRYIRIPNVKDEIAGYRKQNADLDKEMNEFKTFVKTLEDKVDLAETLQSKSTKMNNINRFVQIKRDQQRVLDQLHGERKKDELEEEKEKLKENMKNLKEKGEELKEKWGMKK